jgi:uncharacterized protein (TIGR02145 family)
MSLRLSSLTLIALFLFSACDNDDDKDPSPDNGVTIGGKNYATVVIGSQTWTSENYDGPGGVSYDANNSKPEYGKYYSKAELESITLPQGWRIPTQEDYTKLAESQGITLPSHGTETEKVKSIISTSGWNHVAGTNSSLFNAHPAGYIFGASAPIGGDIAEFWAAGGVTLSIQEAGLNLDRLRVVFLQSDNSPLYKFNVRFVKD